MDVLLAGNEPSLWKGRLPALNVQRHYLWKSFRTKTNTIPELAEKCSASARNPVRLHPGIVFGINPERCSASPRNPVRLDPESPRNLTIGTVLTVSRGLGVTMSELLSGIEAMISRPRADNEDDS
jgi:hypothetical protein